MTTYYVSVGGSDNGSGTQAQPFASLQHAHNLAQPGDTIYLRGGVYKVSSAIVLTKDGTASAPITIQSYPGEKAVLDGSARTSGGYYAGWVVDMNSASYNVLKNIEIRNGAEGGLVIRGASNNNVIENLDVHHNGRLSEWEGKGIVLTGSSANNLLINNDSHHNQDLNLGNADGYQIATTGAGNVLRGNRAWANSDDGFDLYNVQNGTVAGAVRLEGNWAFNNGWAPNGGAGTGDGTGFKLGGVRAGTGGQSGAHVLEGNVSTGNRTVGFDENGWNGGTNKLTLTNNSSYDNGQYNYLFEASGHVFTNNLAGGTGKTSVASGTQKTNTWNLSVTVNSADFISTDKSFLDDARQADGTLPAAQTQNWIHEQHDLGAFISAALLFVYVVISMRPLWRILRP